MSSPHFHGGRAVLSLNEGDHITRPQYGLEGKSRVRLIEGLAINRAVNSKLVLTVSAQYCKKSADNAVDDQRNPRSLAPLEMQSSQGKLLMAMLNDREPSEMISRVASQQLGRLAAASTSSSPTGHLNAHEGVLYRRIADIKEKERSRALQDIIYALVASRMVDAMVASPDQLISAHLLPGQHGFRMDDAIMAMPDQPFLPDHLHHRDGRLQAIHSLDVRPLIERHVAMVINGKDHPNNPFQPHEFARVCKFEMGKMYAASVMHGHFLTRVHKRFKLDRGVQLEAGSMGSATMEAYMEVGFDAETLRRVGRMRCTHSVDVIERHVEALFGKPPVHMQHLEHRRPLNTTMNIQLGNVKSLILEALAFGALLWDVEYNFISLFCPLCLED